MPKITIAVLGGTLLVLTASWCLAQEPTTAAPFSAPTTEREELMYAADGGLCVPGRAIVILRSSATLSAESVQRVLDAAGDRLGAALTDRHVLGSRDPGRAIVLVSTSAPVAKLPQELALADGERTVQVRVEPDYVRYPCSFPDDYYYNLNQNGVYGQWNLRIAQFEPAWGVTQGSPQTLIAFLDSGYAMVPVGGCCCWDDPYGPPPPSYLDPACESSVCSVCPECCTEHWDDHCHALACADPNCGCMNCAWAVAHPDLAGKFRMDLSADCGWIDCYRSGCQDDITGHGTSVFGIAVATTNNTIGIAAACPDCMGVSYKVGDDAFGDYEIIAAIDQAITDQVAVINMSFGGTDYSEALCLMIQDALGAGIVVVAAAGDNSSSLPWYPAACPGVLSVTGTKNNDTFTTGSNFGSWVKVAAPSKGLLPSRNFYTTTVDGAYAQKSGTSYATPLVAGLAGLIKSLHPDMSAEGVVTQIVATADPIFDIPYYDPYKGKLGSGRVNAYQAVTDEIPRFEVTSVVVHDDPPSGNGNGFAQAKETVDLAVTIRNISGFGATSLSATLETTDPHVTLLVPTVEYDTPVAPGQPAQLPNFRLHLAPDTPPYTPLELSLRITADGGASQTVVAIGNLWTDMDKRTYQVALDQITPVVYGGYMAFGNNQNGYNPVFFIRVRNLDPAPPTTGFAAVAAGGSHSLGLKSNGSIVAWGYNAEGQCNVPAPNTGFVAVAAGGSHSLGLKSNGSIVAWGYNADGQCNVPAPNTGFVAVAAGGSHSLGLKSDGSIVAWGYNAEGQCNVPAPNTGFVAVAAGGSHSLGLKSDGSIVAWGYNAEGQCNVPAPNTGFVAVAGGECHSLGVKSDGSLVAWGCNDYGQCNVTLPEEYSWTDSNWLFDPHLGPEKGVMGGWYNGYPNIFAFDYRVPGSEKTRITQEPAVTYDAQDVRQNLLVYRALSHSTGYYSLHVADLGTLAETLAVDMPDTINQPKAWNAGTAAGLVWEDYRNPSTQIFGAGLSADWTACDPPTGEPIVPNSSLAQGYPAVSADGNVVLWTEGDVNGGRLMRYDRFSGALSVVTAVGVNTTPDYSQGRVIYRKYLDLDYTTNIFLVDEALADYAATEFPLTNSLGTLTTGMIAGAEDPDIEGDQLVFTDYAFDNPDITYIRFAERPRAEFVTPAGCNVDTPITLPYVVRFHVIGGGSVDEVAAGLLCDGTPCASYTCAYDAGSDTWWFSIAVGDVEPGAYSVGVIITPTFGHRTQDGCARLVVLPRGDLNCDGWVNFDDINPFVLALSDPASYQIVFPNCNFLNGDCNGDGEVNFDDINPFVGILSGH